MTKIKVSGHDEIIKRPVPEAIRKEIPVSKVEKEALGHLSPKVVSTPDVSVLPGVPKVEKPSLVPKVKYQASGLLFREQRKARLKVLHNKLPPLKKDKVPPCEECVSTACCHAYVIHLSKEEYESGLYGDNAIKVHKSSEKELSKFVGLYEPFDERGYVYLLNKMPYEPCPFLKGKRCGIYQTRPLVCRMYTCLDDPRIDQDVRDGKRKVGVNAP